MGIDIKSLVATAFTITKAVAPQAVETITYKYQSADTSYSPSTGLTTDTLTSIPSVDCIRTKLSEAEKVNLDANPDLEIRATDRTYAIAHNKLGRKPVLGDVILLSDSTNWTVIGVSAVPGDSLYKVLVRRP